MQVQVLADRLQKFIMAPPRLKVTQEMKDKAELLAGLGVPQKDIALILGIGETSLLKYCSDEMKRGIAKANSKVAGCLFDLAVNKKQPAALFFWAKTRMGWRETDRIEHTGADGKPIQTQTEFKITLAEPPKKQIKG